MLWYIFPAGIFWLAKSGAQFNGSDEIATDETVQVHPPAVFWTREIWEVLKTLYGESCFTAYIYIYTWSFHVDRDSYNEAQ